MKTIAIFLCILAAGLAFCSYLLLSSNPTILNTVIIIIVLLFALATSASVVYLTFFKKE